MRILLNGLVFPLLFLTPLALLSETKSPAHPADTFKTVTLDVQKMDCPMCKITIRKALEKVAGVKKAKVDYDAKTATVTFDPGLANINVLTQATTDAGYPSVLKPE